ncbi:hypothetical protein GCM10010390_26690 [Streptomyces mordarskii]|uniref:Transposase n=1 Tax=Streptomyces mordarskii TaxID=1226758 RepID=A0ABP3MNX7_9ACTN
MRTAAAGRSRWSSRLGSAPTAPSSSRSWTRSACRGSPLAGLIQSRTASAQTRGLQQPPNRRYLRRRGIRHVIPEKADQAANRARRGSAGGQPPGFDKDRYKKRNTVERAINKLKAFPAVATRFDKHGYVYLGTVTAAALVIWLRS